MRVVAVPAVAADDPSGDEAVTNVDAAAFDISQEPTTTIRVEAEDRCEHDR